jgi:hypothetical protein
LFRIGGFPDCGRWCFAVCGRGRWCRTCLAHVLVAFMYEALLIGWVGGRGLGRVYERWSVPRNGLLMTFFTVFSLPRDTLAYVISPRRFSTLRTVLLETLVASITAFS